MLFRWKLAARRRATAHPRIEPDACGPTLLCENKRTDRRFLLLMYAQWVAAVCLSTWFRPVAASMRSASRPDTTPLLFAVVSGGVAALACTCAVRSWSGSRTSRCIIALCQMHMSSVLVQLSGGQFGMHFHIYGSLAFLAVYADWMVLLLASLAVLADGFLLNHSSLTPMALHVDGPWRWATEAVWLTLCDGFLLWSNRERARSTRAMEVEQVRQRVMLERAFRDTATTLPNRAAAESHVEQSLEAQTVISCLFVEVDGITIANETLNPAQALDLLRSVVARLQDCVPHGDMLSRYGTARFLVLVERPHTRPQLVALAESLVGCMATPHKVDGRTLPTSVSVGIATAPLDAEDRDALIAAAERAMYSVKCDGRNQHRFASEMRRPNEERNLVLSRKLERALLEGNLHLVYQPIYDLGERMVAAEVLARWRDPVEGLISPAEFVPIAEQTGLIVPLSNWVLREACHQMVEWKKLGAPLERIAVNVSVKQVWRSDFVDTVEKTLAETGLSPYCLELEVTESALANNFDTVKRNLQTLRRLGVRISIDDFGTGYSSLSRVRELDADTLKVDRLFVQGASETPNGVAVVQAIIDMAHTLQLSVVAEGVETEEQLQMLRDMRCDEVQGFLLARPQPSEALDATFGKSMPARHETHGLSLAPGVA